MIDKLVDIEHPDALKYIEAAYERKREYAAGRRPPGRRPIGADPSPTPARAAPMNEIHNGPFAPSEYDAGEDPRDFLDLTLREIGERFGTAPLFVDYLKAIKEIEKIHETRLKNGEREGELITRHIVSVGIIDPLNSAHTRLLTDGARSIARKLHTMYAAGSEVTECERWVSERIGSFIKAAKAKAAKVLREC